MEAEGSSVASRAGSKPPWKAGKFLRRPRATKTGSRNTQARGKVEEPQEVGSLQDVLERALSGPLSQLLRLQAKVKGQTFSRAPITKPICVLYAMCLCFAL